MTGPPYEPLYPASGGPPRGFVCNAPASGDLNRACGSLFKTETAVIQHLETRHGIGIQLALFTASPPS